MERSVVNIVGNCFFVASNASGILAEASLATHWFAPAGLLDNSHSLANKSAKKSWLHFVGVVVHVTSKPDVIASAPFPVL